MKWFAILSICTLLITSMVSSANINKRQTNDIESLLKELQKSNININENVIKESEPGVRDALQQLLTSIQQMGRAYVGVITSLGKSLGLPGLPGLPGLQGIQFLESPIVVKQIEENVRQIQEMFGEVSRSITGILSRDGPQNGNVLLDQFRKFLNLWQRQITEVSGQVTRALTGGQLLARDENTSPVTSVSFPLPFVDWFQQFVRLFQDTFTDISSRFSRLIYGGSNSSPTARQQSNQTPVILSEIQQIFESFQKQLALLAQQLTRGFERDSKPPAEHRNKDDKRSAPEVQSVDSRLRQFQQTFKEFQKQINEISNQFSKAITGQL